MLAVDVQALSAPTPASRLDRYHNFAELAVVLEITVNFYHVVELERAIDHRLEGADVDAFEDELHSGLLARRITAGQPNIVPLDGRHLGDHLEHRQRSDTLTERAVDVHGSLEG